MKAPTRLTRRLNGQPNFNSRRPHLMGRRQPSPLQLRSVCEGTFNEYPCTLTINDLSTNTVSLLPGVYITTAREFEMEEIRTRLLGLEKDFWERLGRCAERKQIMASDHTACIAFCHWASLPFNCKLVSVFFHSVLDTLTITIGEECITCNALNLNSCTAKNLLDTLACVALATGLFDPKLNGDAAVNVTTTYIDNFSVCLTVRLSPSYIKGVKMDAAHLTDMYGHILANVV